MSLENLFTRPDAWSGGYFILAMELGPRSDANLRTATIALWGHASFEGCFVSREAEPRDQSVISADQSDDNLGESLYGIATTPNGHEIPCASFTVRYDAEDSKPAADWLKLALPMGGLEIAYPVGAYPFGTAVTNEWLSEVNDWLGKIGTHVYEHVRFLFGIIGHEVPVSDESASWIAEHGIPKSSWDSYLIPQEEGLQRFLAVEHAPTDDLK